MPAASAPISPKKQPQIRRPVPADPMTPPE
jgi:hypothetical protein